MSERTTSTNDEVGRSLVFSYLCSRDSGCDDLGLADAATLEEVRDLNQNPVFTRPREEALALLAGIDTDTDI